MSLPIRGIMTNAAMFRISESRRLTIISAPSGTSTDAPASAPPAGMVWIPGGTFRMGSDRHYPEEAPAHRVTVDGFWIDRTPVTNREFRKFVNATGHVTFAEIAPDPKDYPGALPHMLKAGSLVFTPPEHPVDLRDWSQWWTFKFGANWRQPYGPRSSISGLDDHPVVHVAYRGRRGLRAAGPARSCRPKPSGSSPRAAGSTAPSSPGATNSRPAASRWRTPGRAHFPHQNLQHDGYERTSPVTRLSAERLRPLRHDRQCLGVDHRLVRRRSMTADAPKACCIPENPRGGREDASYDPCQPQIRIPRKVLKGGSHLCAPNYCRRYRPAARHAAAGRHLDEPCRLPLRASRGSAGRHDARPALRVTSQCQHLPMTWPARLVADCGRSARASASGSGTASRSRSISASGRHLIDRPGGPMTFRFILQPAMAAIAALHDGIKDARLGRIALLLDDPARPGSSARVACARAWSSTARIILLGLGMDAIYQFERARHLLSGRGA